MCTEILEGLAVFVNIPNVRPKGFVLASGASVNRYKREAL